MAMDAIERILVLTLILHDAGWVLLRPEIGVPAMLVGVGLQAYIVGSYFKDRSAALLLEVAVLIWVVGNFMWTCCEFLWEDDGKPVGFLANIDALSGWDAKWYPTIMRLAVGIMTFACFWMLIFHVLLLATTARRSRRRVAAREGRVRLREEDDDGEHALVSVGCCNGALVLCLPLHDYFDLFLLPWIFMDTSWTVLNLRAVLGLAVQGGMLGVGTLLGVASVATLCDAVRRSRRTGAGSGATAFYLAELIWVAGNVTWMVGDVLAPDRRASGVVAASLFGLGVLLCLLSLSRIARSRRARSRAAGPAPEERARAELAMPP